jgi:uncharacterized protein (DUF305 family)
MSTQTAWIITGIAIIGGIGIYLWGGDSYRGGPRAMVDQHFIEQMIPHHEGAIDMARLAFEKSKRPEVLSLAAGIIEAQEKEIVDMRAWYREWFDRDVPEDGVAMMGMDHMMHAEGMVGDPEALRDAPDFDKEFLSQMIVHHEMAVMMGQMLASGTRRAEMKELAHNIVTSQQREIELMRSWLSGWYN